MKSVSLFVSLVLLIALPFASFAGPYDKDMVVAGMRANVARIGAIRTALGAQDFAAAAQGFYDYGKLAVDLQKMDPPKGSADEWVRLWKLFQDKSFLGVGACGERDAVKAQKILDEIVAINKEGHPAFRF